MATPQGKRFNRREFFRVSTVVAVGSGVAVALLSALGWRLKLSGSGQRLVESSSDELVPVEVGGGAKKAPQGTRQGGKSEGLEGLLEVKVAGVLGDPAGSRVVILSPAGKSRKSFLRIWIGPSEALAIDLELHGKKPPRPFTHDLLKTVITELGGRVERVVISDFREDTYYASLYIRASKEVKVIDARPSDSIALALRAKAPIYLSEKIQRMLEQPPEEPKRSEPKIKV